jgi:hypothetical protein
MRFHIQLILFLYVAVQAPVYSQMQEYSPKVAFAIETYVFLKGQSTALKAVSKQYPALRDAAAATEKKAESSFGRAAKNIERFLQDELEHSDYNLLQSKIDSLLNEQLKNPIEKEKHARDFLRYAEKRLHFIPDTLLYKGIMSFKYHDAPHQEIKDGHLDIFTSYDHPKSRQTMVKVPVPKSWIAEEAEIPETIQQFTSCNGKGIEKIILMIMDLPAENKNFILNEKSIKSILPPQTTLLRTEAIMIDNRPGMMIEVEENLNTHSDSMKIRMLQFMCIHEEKLYCLQGSIGPVKADRNLAFHIKKYEPLFRLVAARTEIGN